jgi:hypothetical protein
VYPDAVGVLRSTIAELPEASRSAIAGDNADAAYGPRLAQRSARRRARPSAEARAASGAS